MRKWLHRALALVLLAPVLQPLQAVAAGVAVIPGVVVRPSLPSNPTPSLHAPWSECDVGSPPVAGVATNGGGTLLVTGAGDVGSNNNSNVQITHVAYQPVTGDVDVVSQLQSITGTFDWREGGIMLAAASCTNTSPWASIGLSIENTGQQGAGFHLHGIVNGRATSYSTGTSGPLPPPHWIRLNKSGSVVTAYYGDSQTGPWNVADSETLTFSGTYYVKMFCSSGDTVSTQPSTCTYSEPIITTPATNAGTLAFSSGTLTVTEGGTFTPCVVRAGGSSGAVSAHVTNTGSGTAGSGDWTTSDLDQTVTFADGDSSPKCVGSAIHTTNRAGSQGDRTLILGLSTFTGGATVGSQATFTVTIRDTVTVTSAKKWHPGYYPWAYRGLQQRYSQSARFGQYDQWGSEPFAGFSFNSTWAALEGATAGDYTAGDAMLLAEIAHLKNEPVPKRFMLMLDDEVYRGSPTDYPAYVVSAGCVLEETWNGGTGAKLEHFKYWIPACATYRANLLTHLGALLDGEPYFEGIILDYEQAYLTAYSSWTDWLTGATTVITAAEAAFPHTNVSWRMNWAPESTATGKTHEQKLVELLAVVKAHHVGWGGEDSCALNPITGNYFSDGSLLTYIDADNIFNGNGGWDTGHHAGTYHDQRGEMYTNYGMEDSEFGYNSVCGSPGGTGLFDAALGGTTADSAYFSLYNWWNDSQHVSHAQLDMNQEIGIPQQQWDVGTTYSLWDMVHNHPLTHTACPTDYDTAFGNGSAGSGCNTN